MTEIKKTKEPDKLMTFREGLISQEGKITKASYQRFYDNCRDGYSVLKQFLLKEQQSLCCYCMSKIDEHSMVVEHYKPKDKYGDYTLDYSNLLASCKGQTGIHRHCDNKKENTELQKIPNPSNHKANIRINQIIDYSYSGEVKIKDALDKNLSQVEKCAFLKDINDVLNLNNEELVRARSSKLKYIINIYNDRRKHKSKLLPGDFLKCRKPFSFYHYVEVMLNKKFQ